MSLLSEYAICGVLSQAINIISNQNLGEAMLPYMIDRHYLKQLVLALIAATDIQEDHQQVCQVYVISVIVY